MRQTKNSYNGLITLSNSIFSKTDGSTVYAASIKIANCTFSENWGMSWCSVLSPVGYTNIHHIIGGAAIYSTSDNAEIIVDKSIFISNHNSDAAAGLNILHGNVMISHSSMKGNWVGAGGGFGYFGPGTTVSIADSTNENNFVGMSSVYQLFSINL